MHPALEQEFRTCRIAWNTTGGQWERKCGFCRWIWTKVHANKRKNLRRRNKKTRSFCKSSQEKKKNKNSPIRHQPPPFVVCTREKEFTGILRRSGWTRHARSRTVLVFAECGRYGCAAWGGRMRFWVGEHKIKKFVVHFPFFYDFFL